jgi:hypothetical protein
MSRFLRPLCGTLALVTLSAATGGAQIMTVTANVPQTLTNEIVTSLTFGVVLPGPTKTIANSHASAGKFKLTGTNNNEVSVSLAFPTNLTSGVNNLPVAFTACHNPVDNPTAGCTAFNMTTSPSPAMSNRLSPTNPGNLYVFLGGTVTPGGAPVAGNYTGQVTLTFSYTGN